MRHGSSFYISHRSTFLFFVEIGLGVCSEWVVFFCSLELDPFLFMLYYALTELGPEKG